MVGHDVNLGMSYLAANRNARELEVDLCLLWELYSLVDDPLQACLLPHRYG
jgi:hypothetical protein